MQTKIKIIAHCLVRNEEKFIKYCLLSALDYVDAIMVWDTGSTDRTVELIKSIRNPKIKFKEMGPVDASTFTDVRNKMLVETPASFTWVFILDGDEVWPKKSIQTVTDYARNHPNMESIVVRTHNLVGDVYHKMPESSGRYHLAGQVGHLNLRLVNVKTIPGLNIRKPHGQQGYFDGQGKLIQDRAASKIKFLDVHYAHATHLQRSDSRSSDELVVKRANKFKYEIGESIPTGDIPEVFFENGLPPHADWKFWLKAGLFTLPRRLKRLLLPGKDGY